MLEVVRRAEGFSERGAIVDISREFNYGVLLEHSHRIASWLLREERDLREGRVAYPLPRGFHYCAVQWGIWRAGGVTVPPCELHPPPELEYTVRDSQSSLFITDASFLGRTKVVGEKCGAPVATVEEVLASPLSRVPSVEEDRRAMILYTSGTTLASPRGSCAHTASSKPRLLRSWKRGNGLRRTISSILYRFIIFTG